MTLDQRHLDAGALAKMLQEAKDASERFAAEENVSVEWKRIWQIEPILFNPALIELADEAIRETCGTAHRLPSGPLHDAAEISRAGVPTVMMFVQSLRGYRILRKKTRKKSTSRSACRRSTAWQARRCSGSSQKRNNISSRSGFTRRAPIRVRVAFVVPRHGTIGLCPLYQGQMRRVHRSQGELPCVH